MLAWDGEAQANHSFLTNGITQTTLHWIFQRREVPPPRPEVLQGTLDLMVLKALDALGPLHGFGIARRLEQISGDILELNEGTVYTALLRLTQKGWISSKWGASENNRKARFYAITRSGRKQLDRERKNWIQISGVIERVLKLQRQS
jgi:transcriptional regulator